MPTVAASSSSAAAASSSSSTAVNVHLHRHGGRASSSGSASAKLPHGHSAAAAAAVVDPRVEILQSENRRLRVHLTQELEAARLARVKYERMARNLVRREKEMTQQAIASDVDAGAGSGFSALRTRKRATIVTRLQAENERLAADLRQCRKDLADLRLERKSSSVVEMKLMLFEYFSEIQRLQAIIDGGGASSRPRGDSRGEHKLGVDDGAIRGHRSSRKSHSAAASSGTRSTRSRQARRNVKAAYEGESLHRTHAGGAAEPPPMRDEHGAHLDVSTSGTTGEEGGAAYGRGDSPHAEASRNNAGTGDAVEGRTVPAAGRAKAKRRARGDSASKIRIHGQASRASTADDDGNGDYGIGHPMIKIGSKSAGGARVAQASKKRSSSRSRRKRKKKSANEAKIDQTDSRKTRLDSSFAGAVTGRSSVKTTKKSGTIRLRKRMTKQESIFVQDLSAVRIQSFAHAVAARKRFRQLIDEKHAAIKIQSAARRSTARARYVVIRDRNRAAVKPQALVRGAQARLQHRERIRRYNSATQIQGTFRAHKAKSVARERRRQRQAAVVLQREERRRAAQKRFEELRRRVRAATRLQHFFRSKRTEREYIRQKMMHQGATQVQRVVRGRQARRRVRQQRTKDNAATRIQCRVRVRQSYKRVEAVKVQRQQHTFVSARKIQNNYRSRRARKERQQRAASLNAVKKVQATYRGYRGRLLAADTAVIRERQIFAATALQSYVRMRQARRMVDRRLEAKDAVVRVQAMWRGASARDFVQLQKARERAAILMQKIVRGFFGRRAYNEMEEHRTRFEYRNVLRDVAATKIQAQFRGRKARLNNKSSTSGQLADRNDVDDLGKAGGATDDVGPDGRRQRPRKLKDDHQPHSGDGAAEATSSAGQKGSNGVDDESKGESWDVLHGVKGMKKTRTGRYVPDDGRDGGDDATPAPSAE